ncbi:MAG: STAS-like domain-containing protein, partial [Clostridiales bacterium]|nr:STAS-like domain-containing protein [Clostridiales bacterium]
YNGSETMNFPSSLCGLNNTWRKDSEVSVFHVLSRGIDSGILCQLKGTMMKLIKRNIKSAGALLMVLCLTAYSASTGGMAETTLAESTSAVIDFEDVTWMGQAFAHQLFVVFANEHPEIKITPTGMNADIQKMYTHVITEDL